MADHPSFLPIEISFDTTLEDIIRTTNSDDSPATSQAVTISNQPVTTSSIPVTTASFPDRASPPTKITFDTTLEDIIRTTNSDDSPATSQAVTISNQPANTSSIPVATSSNPDRASSPHSEISFDTTLKDIIKATILDDSPDTTQAVTTSNQPVSTASNPDNTISQPDIDTSQPDIKTSRAETRFDKCLASLFKDQTTPVKFPDNDLPSDLQLALQRLPPPPQQNISNENIISSNQICALQSNFRSDATSYSPSVLIKSIQPEMSTTSREQLLPRLDSLRPFHPQQMNDLTSFYKYQSAQVETDRYCAPHQSSNQPSTINNRRTRPSLSQKAVQLMEAWYNSHLDRPYPSPDVIQDLATRGGIKEEQVKKWFSNKRSRSKQPSGIRKKK